MKSFFLGFAGACAAMILFRLTPVSVHAQANAIDASIVRARQIVVVDDQGRDRVIIGGPIKDPNRTAPMTGLIILDQKGHERIGMGVYPQGNASIGLDAPAGNGDDRNRERIVMEADANGGAEIDLFNKKTFIAGRLRLRADEGWELTLRKLEGGKIKGQSWTANKGGVPEPVGGDPK